jgi:hypothetical protein
MRTLFITLAIALGVIVITPRASFALTNKTLGSSTSATNAQDVIVVGSYAYVADGAAGIRVFTATSATPTLVTTVDTPDNARRVDAVNTTLYVADGSSLQILSLANPAAPVIVGTYPGGSLTINDVASDGVYAYLLGTVASVPTMVIVDVTNPAAPALAANNNTVTVHGANDVLLAANYAYVVGGSTLDIVNDYPTTTIAGIYTNPTAGATYQSVQVLGSLAYVNDSALGMHAVTIANPTAPTLAFESSSLFPSTGYGSGAAISNGFLFLNTTAGGIVIYDVATSTTPSYVDTYQGSAGGVGLTVANDIAYAANGAAGLQLLDVSKPDTVPPQATIIGNTVTTITPGGKFVDPGITVVGGTVTSTTGKVDTATVGKYTITYTVSDRVGNITTVSRVVYVAPTITTVALKNGALTIVVNKKKVTIRPFVGYRGNIIAKKAILHTAKDPYYVFITTDARRTPEIALYNYLGKLVSRTSLKTISIGGLQVDIAANPVSSSVYIAVAAKVNVLKVSIFNLNRSGVKLLTTFTTAGGKGTLVMKFLKLYKDEYGLATLIRGKTKAPYVWRYGGGKKGWFRDISYDLSRLKWTTTSVSFK